MTSPINSIWHDPVVGAAMVDHLAFLLLQERCSFGVIGARLGVTKNMALGKAHREGFIKSKPQQTVTLADGTHLKRGRRSKRLVAAPDEPAPAPAPAHEQPAPKKVLTNGLTSQTCHFPMWPDDAPHDARFYCSAPVAKGPYCAQHIETCWRPVQQPRRRDRR